MMVGYVVGEITLKKSCKSDEYGLLEHLLLLCLKKNCLHEPQESDMLHRA